MCWQCDHPNPDPNPDSDSDSDSDGTLAHYLAQLRETILRHGWAVQCVDDDRRPFAYTIGLHDRGLPELLVTGLAPQKAGWLLNTFAKRTLAGRAPIAGHQVFLPAGTRLELVDVAHPDAHLNTAIAIEGPDITAVQLVWADDRGRWPWAAGFDDGRRCQPVLGARTQNA